MSKKENKRFNDNTRKTAPKRGGKNRRDYGENYEPHARRNATAGRAERTAARRSYHEDFREIEVQVGNDGLEVVAGRNPVMEALNGEREVERIFIAEGGDCTVRA